MSGHLIISKTHNLFGLFLVLSFFVTGPANAVECSGSAGVDSLAINPIGHGDGWVQTYLSWSSAQTAFGYVAQASSGPKQAFAYLDIPKYVGSDPCFTSKIGGRAADNDIAARRSMYFQATRKVDTGTDEACRIDFDIPWQVYGYRSSGDVGGVQVIAHGVVVSINEYTWASGKYSTTITIPKDALQSTAQAKFNATVRIDPPWTGVNTAVRASVSWKSNWSGSVSNECGRVVQVAAPAPPGVADGVAGIGEAIPEASVVLQEGNVGSNGAIMGSVISSVHVAPVDHGRVSIYNDSGVFIESRDLEGGPYLFEGLQPGTYYARTESTGYFDELSDDIPCLFGNCIVTDGNPVSVSSGSVSTADFELDGPGDQPFFDGFESN